MKQEIRIPTKAYIKKAGLTRRELACLLAEKTGKRLPCLVHGEGYPSKLRSCRNRSGFTHKQLAYLLGMKEDSAIPRFETGQRVPTMAVALGLSAVFGGDVAQLFPGLEGSVRREVAERAGELLEDMEAKGKTGRVCDKLKLLQAQSRKEAPATISV